MSTLEFNGMSEDKFVQLLLSATQEKNTHTLKNHLLTVTNPNLYLNRVYDQAHMQTCTLLAMACLNEHVEVIRMLLDWFQPDLEVLNNIIIGDGTINRQLFSNVSVLWIATSINNLEMVMLLVEHGANVNHRTKTNSTPIRGACYNGNIEIVRYLIDNGADIDIAKENNDTNLMVSVCHKHLNLVSYLVEELHCDVNICDDDGRPALYDAVNCGSLELVEFLLQHGARNFRAIGDEMSPLMWAAEKKHVDLVAAISSHCSLVEQIEAKELLGSAFVCGSNGGRVLDQSFEHLRCALELRLMHNLPKPLRATTNEIFNNRQEYQTVTELETIQSNFNEMCIEALLVRERILGPKNGEYRYSLCYRGAILADNGEHQKAIDHWIYELSLCQQYSISLDSKHLRRFVSLFSGMFYKTKTLPMESLLRIIKATTEELEHDQEKFNFNLHTLLFLITVASQFFTTYPTSITNNQAFFRHLCRINLRHYTTIDSGMSLLHLSLAQDTLADDYRIRRICKYPCLSTARLLLQCEADVDAFDVERNTPLHIIASHQFSCEESILTLLYDAGAHLDYVNALGQTPIDAAIMPYTKQLLTSKMKLRLKCLCARLIRKEHVPFREHVSISLSNFVEKH